jgi:hypothetical protein
MEVRIARCHNIFGPQGSWNDGLEKAPAAICRKVAMAEDGKIEIWGDGKQTGSDTITGNEDILLLTTAHRVRFTMEFLTRSLRLPDVSF